MTHMTSGEFPEVVYPTEAAAYICEELWPRFRARFLEKNAGYGDMHNDLGTKAQFVDLNRKTAKLRRALWDGKDIGPESAEEVLYDLIGHCFLTLDLMDREQRG
jgi:hypothetical protein